MVRGNWRAGVGFIILVALVLAGCSTAAPAATEAVGPAPASAEPVMTEEPAAVMEPAVQVDDQDVSTGTVTVKEVDSAGPGWMVIHATTDAGGPGPVLGYSHVEAGSTAKVMVEIDLAGATDQLFAMLHIDAGTVGTYEFPDGADVPARVGDQIVNVPFQVTLPVAEMSHPTIELAESSLGSILVDGRGFALYLFTPDNQGDSTCYDSCATNWPPLVVDGESTVGEGLDAGLLGTVERADGSLQLTYAGWPLYYFFRDGEAGEVNGQGVNDVWFLLKADGSALVGGDGLPDY